MELITKTDIKNLAHVHSPVCVSIFIPTHRSGAAVTQQRDALVLKNRIKEVTHYLESQNTEPKLIERIMAPAVKLIDAVDFWNYRSDGLALFLSEDLFKKFTLPVSFETFHYVSNEFFLKPLMPMFTGDGRFFILALQLHNVDFYEGHRHSIADVIIEDLTPGRLEEVVGHDYEQKSLQFRSQKVMHKEAAFHGHGEGSAKSKDEILQFCRAVDKGLMKMLYDERAPMVVACLDYVFPIYQEANTYSHLIERHISHNPSDLDTMLLHELAWEIVQPIFNKDRGEKLSVFMQLHDSEMTSSDIQEILPAAIDGRVDTLFIENRTDLWGIYDKAKRKTELSRIQKAPNVSLTNLAAIRTFLQGGTVYLMEKEEMPEIFSTVNALFRY